MVVGDVVGVGDVGVGVGDGDVGHGDVGDGNVGDLSIWCTCFSLCRCKEASS